MKSADTRHILLSSLSFFLVLTPAAAVRQLYSSSWGCFYQTLETIRGRLRLITSCRVVCTPQKSLGLHWAWGIILMLLQPQVKKQCKFKSCFVMARGELHRIDRKNCYAVSQKGGMHEVLWGREKTALLLPAVQCIYYSMFFNLSNH